MLGLLSAARLQPLSPELAERTLRRLRDAQATTGARAPESQPAATVREIWAILRSDSLRPNLALRGPEPEPRILLYDTPEFAVALSVTEAPESGASQIRGQITPHQADSLPALREAAIVHAGHRRTVAVSEFGEFLLADLPGPWDRLEITLGDVRVRLPRPPA